MVKISCKIGSPATSIKRQGDFGQKLGDFVDVLPANGDYLGTVVQVEDDRAPVVDHWLRRKILKPFGNVLEVEPNGGHFDWKRWKEERKVLGWEASEKGEMAETGQHHVSRRRRSTPSGYGLDLCFPFNPFTRHSTNCLTMAKYTSDSESDSDVYSLTKPFPLVPAPPIPPGILIPAPRASESVVTDYTQSDSESDTDDERGSESDSESGSDGDSESGTDGSGDESD